MPTYSSNAPTISRLEQLFATAVTNGFKKPSLRASGLKLYLAAPTGRNAGSIYVTHHLDGTYLGKITNGRLFLTRETSEDYRPLIENIMALPMAAAIRYGHQTGSCSICGRRLDNRISVAMGIGPICAEKLGIPIETGLSGDIDTSML